LAGKREAVLNAAETAKGVQEKLMEELRHWQVEEKHKLLLQENETEEGGKRLEESKQLREEIRQQEKQHESKLYEAKECDPGNYEIESNKANEATEFEMKKCFRI
jgi:hypothetical protein